MVRVLLDCGVLKSLFTDVELKTMGSAIVGLVLAAIGLCVAYVARIAKRWVTWER